MTRKKADEKVPFRAKEHNPHRKKEQNEIATKLSTIVNCDVIFHHCRLCCCPPASLQNLFISMVRAHFSFYDFMFDRMKSASNKQYKNYCRFSCSVFFWCC